MKEEKICKVCGMKINEPKERYVHLEDWAFGNFEKDCWWHLQCFKKAMNRDLTLLERQASEMLSKAGDVFNNLPEEFTTPKEKEYVV